MTLEDFKNKFEHEPTEIYPSKSKKDVLVSVCVVTYNQVDFIGKCLDSLINQKTNFSFEILLGDDASTDGTRELCVDYANKYPEIIRLFLHKRGNNINIAGRPTGRFNFLFNLLSANGKYIALCEGDDFWIDLNKLQKQTDFLENNKAYKLTHSDANIYEENTKKTYTSINKIKNRNIRSGDVFLDKLQSNYRIFTSTTLFRNSSDLIPSFREYIVYHQADLVLFLDLAKKGLVKYFDEPMGTYRVNNASITQSGNSIQKVRFKKSSSELRLEIAQKYNVAQLIIDQLQLQYNKTLLDFAYLTNDADLMLEVVAFLEDKNVQLNKNQQRQASIILNKGFSSVLKKKILKLNEIKSKEVRRLMNFKNRYLN